MANLIMDFIHGAVQNVVNPLAKFGNELGAGGEEINAFGQALGGNTQASLQSQQTAQKLLNPGGGLLHQGGVLQGGETTNDAVFANPSNILKTVGTGAEIASNVVGGGAAKTAVEGAAKTGGSKLVMDFIKGAKVAAPAGAIGTAGGELANGQGLNPGQIAEGAAGSALLGGTIGAVSGGIPLKGNEQGGINNPSDQFRPEDLQKLAKSDDPKEIEKTLEPVTGPVVAKEISAAVATTDDPAIVKNEIDNALNSKVASAIPPPSPTDNINTPAQVAQQANVETPPSESKSFMNTPGEVRGPTIIQDQFDTEPRGFTESVKESPSVSPEVKGAIDNNYTPTSNKQLMQKTGTVLDKGLDTATQKVDTALAQPTGSINAQDVSNALAVARAHDVSGNFEKAQSIYDRLAEHGTSAGQTIQALSMLDARTPEGLRFWVNKTLKKADVPLTDDLRDNLNAAFEALKQSPEDTPGHQMAVGKIQQLVGSQLPSSTTDKAFAVWRAGLLTGPQTVTKIVTSHAINSLLENVKDVPGAVIDKFLSNFTGQRSLVASTKGAVEGFKEGATAGKNLVKTGIDINPGSNAAELRNTVNFGNSVPGKFLSAYVNGVGRIHGSLYKPFFGAAHAESLYNQALAAAKTQGLKGDESDRFVTDFVHSPDPQALKIAQHDAEMATFQQTTKLGQVASAIQQKGGVVGKVIAPFTRIPSALATDLINYSPIGGMKSIVDGIKAAKSEEGLTVESQRQLSQGLGRSITGAAAIIPGIMLYNRGMLTLGYPTDPKEQALWQDEGKQPDSVLIGGQWRKLGAIGPIGSVLSIGGYMADSLLQGQDMGTASMNGLVGGLKSIEGQSYLSGVSSSIDALNNPGQYASSFAKQTAGSIIPTGINTIANATDPMQRNTTGNNLVQTSLDAIKARIPGARETLQPKEDAFGNPLRSGETGLERIVDPFQSTTAATPSPLLDELRRLENAGFGEMPAKIAKKENLGSTRQPEIANLSRQQMQQLTEMIGRQTEQYWNQAINSPGYSQLTDMQKQATLAQIYGSTAQQEKSLFAQLNSLGPYSSNVQQTILQSKQKRPQVV